MTDAVPSSVSTSEPVMSPSLPLRPIVAPLIAHRGTATALGLVSSAQIVLTTLHLPGLPCPFLRVTGIPCPGCGLSRACAAMITGDPQLSLRMHAFALPILIGVATLLLSAVLPAPKRMKMSSSFARFEGTTGLTFVVMAALLIYWLGRLLYAPHEFISLIAHP